MAAPKVRDSSFPLLVGKDFASYLWNIDVAALLFSVPHWKLKSGAWSGGSEFYQVSKKATHNTQSFNWVRNDSYWTGCAAGVAGLATLNPLSTSPVSDGAPDIPAIIASFGTLDEQREAARADFTAGWSRTRPGNPEASLAQFIAELRDFPSIPGSLIGRKLVKRVGSRSYNKRRSSFYKDWVSGPVESIPLKLQHRIGLFRSLGEEYLNHVFGWAPFVRDLQKLYVLSQTIDNRIKQIARDNGRGIRRKATVSNDQEVSTSVRTNAFGPFYGCIYAPPSWAPSGGSTWTTVTKTERKSWFSARYRYYIPDVGSGGWIPKARRALYGGNITPSTVWELTPWSWLTDWFVNVGEVLSNFSENAVENLVADYAFCMIHSRTTTTNSSTGSWSRRYTDPALGFYNNVPAGSHNLSSTYVTESKVRVLGSPYGLGVKFSDLTPRQLGVLAALGISKSSF